MISCRGSPPKNRGYNSELTRASKRDLSYVVCGDNITEFIATEPQNLRSVLKRGGGGAEEEEGHDGYLNLLEIR